MIVEDDEIMRMMLANDLGQDYALVAVDSAEACLAALAETCPDVILMDVELPGMNGYEACRVIREERDSLVPVIFISAHDQLDDRLKGYDAGGNDYIVKPFELSELHIKVALSIAAAAEFSALQQRADFASRTAMTAINSLGETGILLQTLQNFNRCITLDELAQAVSKALTDYALTGMVRLCTQSEQVLHGNRGPITPIERSVIEQVATMGRIVEFRSRLSVTYPHVVIVVTNSPMDDEDRRGRLKDHLAILAEAAEASIVAISRGRTIARAIQETSQALLVIENAEREMHASATIAMQRMTDELEKAFMSAALTEAQEQQLASIIAVGMEEVRDAMQLGVDVLPLLAASITGLKNEVA